MLQCILPFFISSASQITPSDFWNYFIIYEETSGSLVAFATVFDSHITAIKFRSRISQVLVLPPYQKKGLGSQLYRSIYNFYTENSPHCFQLTVEDSADDFQRLQDTCNVKVYLDANKELVTTLLALPISKVI